MDAIIGRCSNIKYKMLKEIEIMAALMGHVTSQISRIRTFVILDGCHAH